MIILGNINSHLKSATNIRKNQHPHLFHFISNMEHFLKYLPKITVQLMQHDL